MASRRVHPPNYRAAQAAARAREGALQAEAAQRIVTTLRKYASDLARLVANLPAGERGARESIVLIRNVARTLTQQINKAIGEGRELTFSEVQNIYQQASVEIAAIRGLPTSMLGAVVNPPLTLMGAYESVNAAAHWKTLTGRYAERAVEEANQIVSRALLEGMSPDELARRLRPYVQGSEQFRDAFRGSGIDLRKLRDPDVADAARQMQYNAYRIAVSETHNARAEAEVQSFIADPYVKAVAWRLSPDRGTLKGPDECDVLAANNFYGLGPGVYPVDSVPLTPHPFDRCERVPITQDKPDPKPTNVPQTLDVDDMKIPRGKILTDAAADRLRNRMDDLLTMTADDPRMAQAVNALAPKTPFSASETVASMAPENRQIKDLAQVLDQDARQLRALARKYGEDRVKTAGNVIADGLSDIKAVGLEPPKNLRYVVKSAGRRSDAYASFRRPVSPTDRPIIKINVRQNAFNSPDTLRREVKYNEQVGWHASGQERQVLHHEMGHALHWEATFDAYKKEVGSEWMAFSDATREWSAMSSWEDWYNKHKWNKYLPSDWVEKAKKIAKGVSVYGATQPVEFVAETFAGLVDGKVYDEPIMELYDELGGVRPKGSLKNPVKPTVKPKIEPKPERPLPPPKPLNKPVGRVGGTIDPGVAKKIRVDLRKLIRAGYTDDGILERLQEKYGKDVEHLTVDDIAHRRKMLGSKGDTGE